MSTIIYPTDAVLAITYNCNSRCRMCSIWKSKPEPELSPNDFKKLPRTLKDVNLSGGEPFLRNDIIEIIKIINNRCNNPKIIISTNAFLTDIIVKRMKEMREQGISNVGIAVSIDGIGKTHDYIRGVPGAFDMAMATVRELKKIIPNNLRLAFTVMDTNINEYYEVFKLAKKEGVQMTSSAIQSSDFYFKQQNEAITKKEQLKKEFNKVVRGYLKSWSLKDWARAYYTHGLLEFAIGKGRLLPNYALEKYFFLDPKGFIYPSNTSNMVLGNIKENEFNKLWSSDKADTIRQKLRKNPPRDWMICTARTAIKKHPIKVGWWVIKNKFR